jgi:hypothetical protein
LVIGSSEGFSFNLIVNTCIGVVDGFDDPSRS